MTITSKAKASGKKFYKRLLATCFLLALVFTWTKGEIPRQRVSATQFLSPRPFFSLQDLFPNPNQGQAYWKLQLINRRSLYSLRDEEEEEEIKEFRGLGLEIRIMAGWNYFAGGDFHRGTRGLFDERANIVSSQGYKTQSQELNPCRSGLEFGAEAIYRFRPRFGISARVSRSHPVHKNSLTFYEDPLFPYLLWGNVDLTILTFMAGCHYVIPIHRRLWLFFTGGPELHLVTYRYNLNFQTPTILEDIAQKANGKGLGAKGSAGLELHLNPQVALILEAHGRLAKISNFQGKEATYFLEGYFPTETETNGSLYYSDAGKYPGLAILSEDTALGKGWKRAVFDFSGIGLHAGLIFRF